MPLSKLWKGTVLKGKKLTALYNSLKDTERNRYSSKEEAIPWFNDRVQLSSLPVRFEIPMDITELKGMNIPTYLCRYCKIPDGRILVYKRYFRRYKSPKSQTMTYEVAVTKELSRAIHAILYDCVTLEAVNKFLQSLSIHRMTSNADLLTFAAVAATAERILYVSFAETAGPVSPGVVRSYAECADFGSLRWKLGNVDIDKGLKTLLLSLG